MGRKIPAKKHRGVKDPLEQQARRMQVLKTKINAPPKDPDEQPVPRSLIQLFAFQNDNQTKPKRTPKRASASHADSNNVKNPISALRKLPGESGRGFSLRINSAIKTLHQSTEPDEYPQDLEEEDAKGEHMAELRARRRRKQRADARARGEPRSGSRAQRLALKNKEKKLRAHQEAMAERLSRPQYERVSFGDVAAAPPTLTAPRRAHTHGADRPGGRDLLLSRLLPAPRPAAERGAGAAAAEHRERARQDAVAAYRQLKALNRQKKK